MAIEPNRIFDESRSRGCRVGDAPKRAEVG